MKYIVYDMFSIVVAASVFPDVLPHSALVQPNSSTKPVSAGFCRVKPDGKVEVWGRSDSLNL
jgi:hypothetical protein